ncbi:MAG: hypothetical protein HOP33_00165 [Verrucomicrobia bacterium]|nr:hypothetical protein [Verrucomicrobiota bacterium]
MNVDKQFAFPPYQSFKRNLKQIDEFSELSELAYGLTLQLLFRHPKEDLSKIHIPKPRREDLSFCMDDRKIESIDVSCEWITLDDYANRTGTENSLVGDLAAKGMLGPVQQHPTSGKQIVIWPKEKQVLPLAELPQVGKKTFSVKVSLTAQAPLNMDVEDMSQFENVQKSFLHLAHSMGKPDEVGDRSKEMLHRSCFLLRWTVFEVFLRTTIHEMFRRHPEKLGKLKRAQKPTLSYSKIMSLSNAFSSVELLREALVEEQIKQSESEGDSIHGLINLLKSDFGFKEDPYQAWFVMRGQRNECDYNTLMEIKEVRNALIHNDGNVASEFFDRFPNVPKRDKQLIVDEAYDTKASLVFRSVAFRITDLINRKLYETNSKANLPEPQRQPDDQGVD